MCSILTLSSKTLQESICMKRMHLVWEELLNIPWFTWSFDLQRIFRKLFWLIQIFFLILDAEYFFKNCSRVPKYFFLLYIFFLFLFLFLFYFLSFPFLSLFIMCSTPVQHLLEWLLDFPLLMLFSLLMLFMHFSSFPSILLWISCSQPPFLNRLFHQKWTQKDQMLRMCSTDVEHLLTDFLLQNTTWQYFHIDKVRSSLILLGALSQWLSNTFRLMPVKHPSRHSSILDHYEHCCHEGNRKLLSCGKVKKTKTAQKSGEELQVLLCCISSEEVSLLQEPFSNYMQK